ncbi:hypothetical protein IEQ34_004635 [Dendrobium chrysotoxum]|uniref:DUF3475 domain-containing protein n=1 Tax=Dendrobium chrysotoxum TaxID=161865 RepID=A0AAV7HEU4_DENCH|nr:hypothetical protein IEQ34_004635 [Dendrobium chrysotoxum]
MSKAVNLWRSLSQEQIARLREEIMHLEGVRKLVSNDDNFLLGLALAETMDSVDSLAHSVTRLCTRSLRKLERFVAAGANLYQELEILAELEQGLRRIEMNAEIRRCQ